MSSSTRFSKESLKCISTQDLKLMLITKFKASNNNQCPTTWFKMQTKIIRLKQSTIVRQMNYVIGGGTWLDIQTLVCLL
jgi:hypothetical protein